MKITTGEIEQRLIQAAEAGNHSIVAELLGAGANPDATNEYGRDALWCACNETVRQVNRHDVGVWIKTVEALIDGGADVNRRYPRYGNATILIEASELGAVDAVRMLVANGADVSAIDEFEASALHRAALFGFADIVKVLVDAGAALNLKTGNGSTPLTWAIEGRQYHEELELMSGNFNKTIEILRSAGGT